MNGKRFQFLIIAIVPLIFAGVFLTGCSTQKSLWGDEQTGLILNYRMAPDLPLTYQVTSTMTQKMNVMGQSFKVTSDDAVSFLFEPLNSKSKKTDLKVTVESFYMKITHAGGEIIPNSSDLTGKSFTMSVSSLGKEMNIEGADEICYDMGQEGKRSITPYMQAFFLDLPDHPVKVGDTWESKDVITDKSETSELALYYTNQHKFEGFENFKGHECIKVINTFSAGIEGNGMQQGMEFVTTGTLEGTETWYFAYKEGILLKSEVNGTASTQTVAEAQKLEIPGEREFSIVTELMEE